jgi:hypothetical protein
VHDVLAGHVQERFLNVGRLLPPHPCQYPHCPQKLRGPALLCDKHRQPRHPRQQRGYDARHEQLRAQLLAERTTCEICGRSFTAADPPELDHLDKRLGNVRSNVRLVHRSFNRRRRNTAQPWCTGTRRPMPGEAPPFHPTPSPSRRRPSPDVVPEADDVGPDDVWIG